ncbi:MAG: hypothetical protein IT440_09020 [Phycisphaeraceae bacterium]|nr:hypothetical protein [Phycisphaeraceae bacterium]
MSLYEAPRLVARPCISRGVSIVEMLLALAIAAMVLTATVVALDASFKAYADTAEQTSVQISSRMVSHRLLTLIRTSTAHGPLVPDAAASPPVTLSGDLITSSHLELLDPRDDILRIEYRAADKQLWLIRNPGETGQVAQPMIDDVADCVFQAKRRRNDQGLWVLERGTIDLTLRPSEDKTLSIENGPAQPVRIIASTMPRKLQ